MKDEPDWLCQLCAVFAAHDRKRKCFPVTVKFVAMDTLPAFLYAPSGRGTMVAIPLRYAL